MKRFLYLEGCLHIPRDPQIISELIELAKQGLAGWFKMESVAEEGGGLLLKTREECLSPGEEHEFLDFLERLSQKYHGKIYGEFEVWWPMAVESGPQWWELSEDGTLYVTESDIVRGDRKPYKEKS
jgi:hypothetical protein